MTNVAKALYQFASGFSWDAYPEASVPSNAELPYITYTVQDYNWAEQGMLQMRLWYNGEDYETITSKIDEIGLAVDTGKSVFIGDEKLVIYKGSPFCQFQPSDETNLKIVYLNFSVHYLTK